MDVCFLWVLCLVCDGPISCPKESYRVRCVCLSVCMTLIVIRCNNNPLHLQWVGRRGQTEKNGTWPRFWPKIDYFNQATTLCSHGGCVAMYFTVCIPVIHRNLLPPSSGFYKEYTGSKYREINGAHVQRVSWNTSEPLFSQHLWRNTHSHPASCHLTCS